MSEIEKDSFDNADKLTVRGQSRRAWLTKMGLLPLAPVLMSSVNTSADFPVTGKSFPAKDHFQVKGTFINAAYTHPMSVTTAAAAEKYLKRRLINDRAADEEMDVNRTEVKKLFARLINATPQEIAWVPSTMAAENLVVAGLGLPNSRNHVITDALHFDGSLYLYGQLAKDGLDVTFLPPRDNRIRLEDIDAAIKPGTKLIALSLVSATTGYQHDLKAICNLAHSKGVLVYADIIQAAGATPIDVRETGVDFCACASYKWLMGDFGTGFLYVREDRLKLMKRSQFGFRQVASYQSHHLPFDPPGTTLFDFEPKNTTEGYFQVGTLANGVMAALKDSLSYILEKGVTEIQAYRQPMINLLQTKLPLVGFTTLTPIGSTSPVVCFAYKNASTVLKPRLEAANINISVYENRIRISPSIYNDMNEINRLIDVLS